MPHSNRRKRFCEAIRDKVDLVFLPISADLHYLTGIARQMPEFGAVIFPGDWVEGLWMTPSKEPVLCLAEMTAKFAGVESGDIETRVLKEKGDPAAFLNDLLQDFALPARPRTAIGDSTRGKTVVALTGILPSAEFLSATELLRPLRRIKTEEEIALMQRSGEITEAAFRDLLPKLRYGMTELDIVSEINYQLQRHGSLGQSFGTRLYCSGPDHPLIFGNTEKTLQRELHPPVAVLTDFGAIHEGYCYDYGRTILFGEPDKSYLKMVDLLMESQARGISVMRAGRITAAEVDAVSRKIITDAGYGSAFRHRLGHGIGLDVHEPPFLTEGDQTVLEEGMLFTVEPSLTSMSSLSARVEDVVVVRAGGGEKLTSGNQKVHVV